LAEVRSRSPQKALRGLLPDLLPTIQSGQLGFKESGP